MEELKELLLKTIDSKKKCYFDIRKLNGEVISRSASWKKLKLLETRKSLLMERRALPPIT